MPAAPALPPELQARARAELGRLDPGVALRVQLGGDLGMLDRERARWLDLGLPVAMEQERTLSQEWDGLEKS